MMTVAECKMPQDLYIQPQPHVFSFENLEVWQKAIEFANQVLDIVSKIETERKHYRIFEQIDGACTSIAANIVEGKGRHSKKEYVRFLYIARGSLFETITFLTLFHKRNWINAETYDKLKKEAVIIGKMLSTLAIKIK